MSTYNDDEWQYHQDSRDDATAIGCLVLSALMLLLIAWMVWHAICFIKSLV